MNRNYLAYGQEKEIKTAPVNTRQKYSGRELDQDGIAYDNNNNQLTNGIGLNCFGARYYDPEIGSWTSTDPADEFWNSYSYVGGDPINFTDPSGMISIPAKPVSMFTSGIGRFTGTASIAGAFDHFTPVGSVNGFLFSPGIIYYEDNGDGKPWTEGPNDEVTCWLNDQGLIDWEWNEKDDGGKGNPPGEDSPDKDNERNKWYWRDWADLREDIGPPENPMNDIGLRNSQLILRKQNLNVRDAVKIEDPVASSSGPAGTYGNWGGPGWSGGATGKSGPVDDLDRIFMMHDVDYLNSGLDFKNNPANYVNPKLNPADFSLIKRTDSLLKLNPSTWSNPPSNPDNARRYGNAANFVFKVKYNYQLIEDLFR